MVNSRFGQLLRDVKVNGRFSPRHSPMFTETSVACPGTKLYPGGFCNVILFTSCVSHSVARILTTCESIPLRKSMYQQHHESGHGHKCVGECQPAGQRFACDVAHKERYAPQRGYHKKH